MRQLISSPIESRIGQLLFVADHRHGVGRLLRPCLKKFMETRILRSIRYGVTPLLKDMISFGFR